MRVPFLSLLVSAAILFGAVAAQASILVGPGDTTVNANDSAYDLIAVDLINPQTLGAGTYSATSFNYEFKKSSPTVTPGGTIQPLLATGGGTSFTVIALGDVITYTSETGGFVSANFGGTNLFTLAAPTTVYGGVFFDGSGTDRMPVGHLNTAGSTFIRYGTSVVPPSVGSAISGGASGTFPRTYDFSIQAVPEPTTLAVWGLLGTLGIALAWRRRR